MRTLRWAWVAVACLACSSMAQVAASSQTGASASSNTSASAGKSGVQAQSSSSAQASQDANVSRGQKGQSNAAAAGNASGQADASGKLAGSTIPARLDKPVDARKCKPGDRLTARTTQNVTSDGQVVIPKGSTMIGHVTEAKARTKGESESSLGIVFDQVQMKNGSTMPMHALIQAVAAGNSAASAGAGDDMLGATGGAMASGGAVAGAGRPGGVLGGATSTVGSTVGGAAGSAGSLGAAAGSTVGGAVNAGSGVGNVAGSLTSTSSGVVGMPGLVLNSQATNAAQGSVLTSSGQNVHLDGGTQMVLRVVGQ